MFTNMEVSISGSHMIGWPSGFSQFEENAQLMKGYIMEVLLCRRSHIEEQTRREHRDD